MKKSLVAMLVAGLVVVAAPGTAWSKKEKKDKKARETELSSEFQAKGSRKITAATFGPDRTTPEQRGEFQVDLIIIAFPDCFLPESAEVVRQALTNLDGSFTIADYYKDYSQGITWPVLAAYPNIYMAPMPLGYYCQKDDCNLIGFEDGGERVTKLREDACKFVRSKGGLKKKGAYTCIVYCTNLNRDKDNLEKTVRQYYPPKPTTPGERDELDLYKPYIEWADPLWPNSLPQVCYPDNGGTIVHELGHVLGAPDYYHASEKRDGVEGGPCLQWAYGPTGPGYCRYIHHAFVPAAAYPKVTKPGEYTLGPRSARFPMTSGPDDQPPLGIFVPSSHPNYLFYLEYCHREGPPVGSRSAEGLLVHVVNVTLGGPMMGPPDLCYTYRKGDIDHKGLGDGDAFLHPGDSFDEKSDPAAVLPNFMPAGIAISDIRTDDSTGTCTFKLDLPEVKATKQELDFSLLPQTEILSLDAAMPTSFRAKLNVKYRGEPLLTEYGFCYGTKKDPTEKTGKIFPLYHRDRYEARLIDLKPGTMYYVRAYARNANGIRYSGNQKAITLPKDGPGRGNPTLFSESDKLLGTWYYQRWYFGAGEKFYNSANPLFALMGIANYYRALPGTATGKGDFDMTRVHCNPSTSRPGFRLAEVEKLKDAISRLIHESGLNMGDFADAEELSGKKKKRPAPKPPQRATGRSFGPSYGDNAVWVAKCAAAFKIKSPEKTFFSCKTEEELLAKKDMIKQWILNSQPVMVIRQNRTMTDEESVRWPLDIAIIDGLGPDDDTFHVVFPGGRDRGQNDLRTGMVPLSKLIRRTTDAMLMFYRPADGTARR